MYVTFISQGIYLYMNINYKLSNSTLHDEKSKAQKKTQTKTKLKKKTK